MKSLNPIFLLFLVLLLPLLTLFHPGLPITHDGQDHVARIANFYTSLSEGNIVPRWANNLNWGYGHPVLMFLYPLPSYASSLLHWVGLSLVDSVKAVFGISYILSALFMFLWLRRFLGKFPAMTGAIIYSFAPYRFVDLFVRGAIGEHVAFVFIPAICYFLLKLNLGKKINLFYFLGVCVTTAGLILSHNAISVMFFPFVVIYALYLFSINRNKLLFASSVIGVIYGFLLSSFFWIPAFMEGKYTLRDIVTKNEALTRFVDFQSLVYGNWNFGGSGVFSVQLGIVPWIFVLAVPICLYLLIKKKREKNNLILFLLSIAFLIASIFLMIPASRPIWETFTILQKFQFPWRFLSISVFSVSLIGALVVYSFINEQIRKAILIFVIIGSLILTKDFWNVKGFLSKPESFYSGIYNSTTDTGESAPIWSVRFMEKRPSAEIELVEGKASIKKLSRTTNKRAYEIESDGKSRLRENTLYFPGWRVFVDGKEQSVEFQDPNSRGLITFFLNNGKHKVDIIFGNTKLRSAADSISLVSLFSLVLLYIIPKKWLRT